jgi:hypothetical protein
MQRLEPMKPESVGTPIRNRYVVTDDARKGAEPSASRCSRDDGAGEAMLRRRARILALVLMTLSGIFMIALVIGAWLLLRG